MNKKALALIAGGLILIALIIYFIFFYDFRGDETPEETGTGTSQTAEPVISKSGPESTPGEPLSAEEQSRESASQLAISFTERYGSSSSQADFSNLSESTLFMTEAFKKRTEEMIAEERAKVTSAPAYASLITQAIVADFVTFNEASGTAEATVSTKRQETNVEGNVRTYDQELKLTLRKVNGEWRVDSATWQ